jgi:hypothetical protein
MAASVTFPTRDSELFQWSLNFVTRIVATPLAYGLTVLQASSYQSAHDLFGDTLAAADPAVRNKPATLAKNQARADLKDMARNLAQIIQGTATVSDAQKAELGLTIPAPRHPIARPGYAPAADVVWVNATTARVRIHDAAGGGTRRKPAGVHSAAVCTFVGPVAPTDTSLYTWQGSTTKSIVDVNFSETLAPGTQAWITVMWQNAKQETGPACTPIPVKINYGMSQAA